MKQIFAAIFAISMILCNLSITHAEEGDMRFVRVTDIGAESFSSDLRFIPTNLDVMFSDIKRTPQFDSSEDSLSSWLTDFTVGSNSGFIFYLVNSDGYIQTIGVSSDYISRDDMNGVEDIVLTRIGLSNSERQNLFNSSGDVRSAFCESTQRRIWLASAEDGTVAIVATER